MDQFDATKDDGGGGGGGRFEAEYRPRAARNAPIILLDAVVHILILRYLQLSFVGSLPRPGFSMALARRFKVGLAPVGGNLRGQGFCR